MRFLATTEIGRRVDKDDRERMRTKRSDEWGMEEANGEDQETGDEEVEERMLLEVLKVRKVICP